MTKLTKKLELNLTNGEVNTIIEGLRLVKDTKDNWLTLEQLEDLITVFEVYDVGQQMAKLQK